MDSRESAGAEAARNPLTGMGLAWLLALRKGDLQSLQETNSDFAWRIRCSQQRGETWEGCCPGRRLARGTLSMPGSSSLCTRFAGRLATPPQPPTYLILGRNICNAVGPPAGSGHLSACFLIRVCGGVFLIRMKAALRATLPGGLAPCISMSSPTHKKRQRGLAPGPTSWAVFGLWRGDGSQGMSLKAEAEMPSGQVAFGPKIAQPGLYWPRNDQE